VAIDMQERYTRDEPPEPDAMTADRAATMAKLGLSDGTLKTILFILFT